MRELIMETYDDLDVIANVCRKMFDDKGKLHVTVKLFEESLSAKQRGLYWRWVSTICADTGDTKDDFHEQAKERIFLNIYLADAVNHQELIQLVETMKAVRMKIPSEYPLIRKWIVKHVSHLDATVKNMKDVLKQLESEANSLGIRLPPPPGPGLTYETQYGER